MVLEPDYEDKIEIIRDIINSYIELDVKLLSDYSISEDLYKLVRVLAARSGNKIDFSKISSVTGINRQKISAYVSLLESTYFIYQVTPFTRNIDKEISQQTKLYFADTGILSLLGGEQLSSGQIFENAIAVQLKIQGTLQYYQKKNGQEIDFIYNGAIALEVKETPVQQDKQTLEQRAKGIDLYKYHILGRNLPMSGFLDFIWGGNI